MAGAHSATSYLTVSEERNMFQFNPGSFPLSSVGNIGHFEQKIYHDDYLLVKMRAGGARAMNTADSPAALAAAMHASPGLSMTDRLERSGMIKKVTSFGAPQAPAMPAAGAAVAMAASARNDVQHQKSTASIGLSLIQANQGADLGRLQMAFADDPNIEYVSKVPMRYLLAKKRTTKKKATTRRNSTSGKTAPAAQPPLVVMWNLQKIRWQAALNAGLDDATDIRVGVLDTGIDDGHPDLPTNEIDYIHDFGNNVADDECRYRRTRHSCRRDDFAH